MPKKVTYVGIQFGVYLLGLLRLVVARELVEDGPAAAPAVIVVGRRRLRVPVGVGILQYERTERERTMQWIFDHAINHYRCTYAGRQAGRKQLHD